MTSISGLIAIENLRWRQASVLPARTVSFHLVGSRLCEPKYKAVYQEIEAATRVPWFVIAVIHEREANQNFARSLAQGDPWDQRSVHVPAGRGPFNSFKDAAVDALTNCAPKAARWTDWSVGGILTILEEYNGLGYANMGKPSPYIWAGTNQYTSGKYTSDGHYSPTVVDTQLGCAGLLMAMQQVDPSIVFGAVPVGQSVPTTKVSPSKKSVPVVPSGHAPPSVRAPAVGSIGDFIKKLLQAIAAMFSRH